MTVEEKLPSRHSNQYSADSACGHCEGVVRHEPWCTTQNTQHSLCISGRLGSSSFESGRPPHFACVRCRMDRNKYPDQTAPLTTSGAAGNTQE